MLKESDSEKRCDMQIMKVGVQSTFEASSDTKRGEKKQENSFEEDSECVTVQSYSTLRDSSTLKEFLK